MPEICRFLGIFIAIHYDDHTPPHFHAKYGECEATVRMADGALTGDLPRRAEGLVIEWMNLHKDELLDNWQRAEMRQPLRRIAPLE